MQTILSYDLVMMQVYGKEHAGNVEALRMINDFSWLEQRFNE